MVVSYWGFPLVKFDKKKGSILAFSALWWSKSYFFTTLSNEFMKIYNWNCNLTLLSSFLEIKNTEDCSLDEVRICQIIYTWDIVDNKEFL